MSEIRLTHRFLVAASKREYAMPNNQTMKQWTDWEVTPWIWRALLGRPLFRRRYIYAPIVGGGFGPWRYSKWPPKHQDE